MYKWYKPLYSSNRIGILSELGILKSWLPQNSKLLFFLDLANICKSATFIASKTSLGGKMRHPVCNGEIYLENCQMIILNYFVFVQCLLINNGFIMLPIPPVQWLFWFSTDTPLKSVFFSGILIGAFLRSTSLKILV